MTSPFRVCREMAAQTWVPSPKVIPGCVGDRLHTCFLLYILELVFDAPVRGMKQRELILLPPEHLQLNSKLHDMFHMLPCHLVLIRHDLYLNMLTSKGKRNCLLAAFLIWSAAWTCCSNLKLAAQAWILDMKRINLRQNLVSIHWTAKSSQRFGLPWIYLNQSLPPKCEFKRKCVSTFHCRTCKSSKISFSLSPRVFAFGPIAIHDLHKYFRTKLSHSVNLFDSLWIES